MDSMEETKARLGASTVIRGEAKAILEALDPVIGVAGKGQPIRLTFTAESVISRVVDEGHIVMCVMEALIPKSTGESLKGYLSDPRTIVVYGDHVVNALKPFGYDTVTIAVCGARVTVFNDRFRRTFRLMGEKDVPEPKQPRIVPDVEFFVGMDDLKGLVGMEKLGETLHVSVAEGKLTMRCSSDVEMSELMIPVLNVSAAKSAYDPGIMTNIVKHLHTEGEITMGYSDDMPLTIECSYGCVDYTIMIAPRLEAV